MAKENILKEFRLKHNLTQKELAEKLGYSLSTIKLYENHSEKISKKIIKKLSEFSDTVIHKNNNELTNITELLEEITKKEEMLTLLEKKLNKEKIELEKEKILIALEENKSDYLKIKAVLIKLKSIVGELDIKSSLASNIKEVTKKEFCQIIEKNIKELEEIKNKFDKKLEDIIYDIK
ncbi:helix-turn-helix transcriptional regulator [Fusobacterium sp. SB021]|uniref:helix-turn-helix transcriptional regulator n=1 Tax=Fusobacterium sp. SB021 TaxID=2744227 RepID=UPI003CF7C8E6